MMNNTASDVLQLLMQKSFQADLLGPETFRCF